MLARSREIEIDASVHSLVMGLRQHPSPCELCHVTSVHRGTEFQKTVSCCNGHYLPSQLPSLDIHPRYINLLLCD